MSDALISSDMPEGGPSRQKESAKGGRKAKRDTRFPGCEDRIWQKRSAGGWAAVPKTLLMVAQLVSEAEKKPDLLKTLIGLWLATWDDCYVDVHSSQSMSLESGFLQKQVPKRAHLWRRSVRNLADLGFVELLPNERHDGEIHHVLLLDPHDAILNLHRRGRLDDLSLQPLISRLVDKALDVGIVQLKALLAPSGGNAKE